MDARGSQVSRKEWDLADRTRSSEEKICESTGRVTRRSGAVLSEKEGTARQAEVYGNKNPQDFSSGCYKVLNEATKQVLEDDCTPLKLLEPFIGISPESIHMGTCSRL